MSEPINHPIPNLRHGYVKLLHIKTQLMKIDLSFYTTKDLKYIRNREIPPIMVIRLLLLPIVNNWKDTQSVVYEMYLIEQHRVN